MKDQYKEDIEFMIENIDDDIRELYNREDNFNNADPTTNMRCWDEDEIEKFIYKALVEKLNEIFKSNPNITYHMPTEF